MTFRELKQWLAEIFLQFTPNQIRAILVMGSLTFLISYLTHDADKLFYHPHSADTIFIREYQDFINQLQTQKQKPYLNRLDQYILKRYDTIELFPFDPNTASRKTLLRLGLTDKQVHTLLNYRNKGGRFYTKDDFRKLYGIRYMQYKILRPYLLLPDSAQYPHKKKYAYSSDGKKQIHELFPFDPNTISLDSLQLLGFSERQAQSIIRARQKGWHFRTKKDFARLYVVSNEKYSELEPYILLPDSLEKSKHKPTDRQRVSTIDINAADKETIQRVLSLPPWTAERIVKYRNALGGFYRKEQLKEVYGFPREQYKEISKLIRVDTTRVSKINIQTASYGELVHHPYIHRDLAAWIIKRREKGKMRSPRDLARYKGLDPYEMRILLHYLKFP